MNIFVAKNGTRQGPYSPDQLKARIGSGDISLSDHAWHEGCVRWSRISDMPELVSMILPPYPQQDVANTGQSTAESAAPPTKDTSLTKQVSLPPSSGTNAAPWNPSGFWPKDGVTRGKALLLGIPLVLVLLVMCLGGSSGFLVGLGVLAISAVVLLVVKFLEPNSQRQPATQAASAGSTDVASSGYGQRHVVAGWIIVAVTSLMSVSILIVFLVEGSLNTGAGSAVFVLVMMFSGGIKMIRQGKEGIRAREKQ